MSAKDKVSIEVSVGMNTYSYNPQKLIEYMEKRSDDARTSILRDGECGTLLEWEESLREEVIKARRLLAKISGVEELSLTANLGEVLDFYNNVEKSVNRKQKFKLDSCETPGCVRQIRFDVDSPGDISICYRKSGSELGWTTLHKLYKIFK